MSRKVDDLHPAAAQKCRALLKMAEENGVRLLLTSTLRGAAQQRALYAQGRKPLQVVNSLRLDAGLSPVGEAENRVVTRAPVSVHQFGCAFDIAVVRDGEPVWDVEADVNGNGVSDYEEAGRMGESLGLRWGGRFGLRDYGHFEYTGGLGLEQLKAGLRPRENQSDKAPALAGADAGGAGLPLTEKKEETMDKVKSGLKTSEFYLALIGAAIPVVNSHLGLHIPIEAVLGIAGVIVSYIISRAAVKRSMR